MKRKIGAKDDVRCHFGYGSVYHKHYACFGCRKMFNLNGKRNHVCPECKLPMHYMGWDFKPPRKNDKKQWDKVRMLYLKGVRWESSLCGCFGPGHNFRTLREAREYQPPTSEGGSSTEY